MDQQRALPDESLVNQHWSSLWRSTCSSSVSQTLAGEILRATLTATAGENSKLKLLTMPGNGKRHAEAIGEARGRGVTVKLVQYDQSDDDQDDNDDDYDYDSDYDSHDGCPGCCACA